MHASPAQQQGQGQQARQDWPSSGQVSGGSGPLALPPPTPLQGASNSGPSLGSPQQGQGGEGEHEGALLGGRSLPLSATTIDALFEGVPGMALLPPGAARCC